MPIDDFPLDSNPQFDDQINGQVSFSLYKVLDAISWRKKENLFSKLITT